MVVSMARWMGKVAVVTGASAGIGAAIAKELAEIGLLVVGFARRPDKIDSTSKQLKTTTGKLYSCRVDVTKEEDIKNGFKWTTEKVGPVSILINNAGLAANTTLLDGSTKDWKRTLDTNVLGLCIATREATKIMREHNIDGHIIHINSVTGHSAPNIPMNVYSASKYAVTALTETLRQELNMIKSKIKITSISPGVVATDIIIANDLPVTPEILSTTPFLDAEDIADAVVYVLSTPLGVQVHELMIMPTGENL